MCSPNPSRSLALNCGKNYRQLWTMTHSEFCTTRTTPLHTSLLPIFQHSLSIHSSCFPSRIYINHYLRKGIPPPAPHSFIIFYSTLSSTAPFGFPLNYSPTKIFLFPNKSKISIMRVSDFPSARCTVMKTTIKQERGVGRGFWWNPQWVEISKSQQT